MSSPYQAFTKRGVAAFPPIDGVRVASGDSSRGHLNMKTSQPLLRRYRMLIAATIGVCTMVGLWWTISDLRSANRRASVQPPSGPPWTVEVADTPELRAKGLSDRDALQNDGLLLVFDSDGVHGIWMRAMRISLDLVWLDRDGRVTYVLQRVPPCAADPCPVFDGGGSASRYVLELSGGQSAATRLQVGDRLQLSR